MFIHSYATYISPYTTTKATPQKEESTLKKSNSFSLKKADKEQNQPSVLKQALQKEALFPNYIFFQQQKSNKELVQFGAIKKYQDAKSAYKENSKMYSLAQKPQNIISGIKKDLIVTQNLQSIKESLTRKEMINTYVENETYYRITAA